MKRLPKHLNRLKKLLLGLVMVILVMVLGLIITNIIYEKTHPVSTNLKYGVSFSPFYAKDLGLDWKQTYISMLDDLKIRYLRLPTYWRDIEPIQGKYDFSQADFLLAEAAKRQANVLMVVGFKQPRWPECRDPNWVYDLTVSARRAKTLEFIQVVINRYKNDPTIWAWQVENEPLFAFGIHCDPGDANFLKTEVEMVRRLDPTRQIVLTDSGELGFWSQAMQLSDIFGTTMYRTVYNPVLGYTSWPLPPAFYGLKSALIRRFLATQNKKAIVAELQGEPWLPGTPTDTPIDRQAAIFTIQNFQQNLTLAQKTGFDQVYLWGIEWWYYMGLKGHPEYLNLAKTIFK